MTPNDKLKMIRQQAAEREKGYRAKALKIYPHVCASCGREFEGAKLKELTVHHKDHNHENNPPNGSNWELLCVYCHDHEHEKQKMRGFNTTADDSFKGGGFNVFDGLDAFFTESGKDESRD